MNKGQKELERISDDLDNMTTKEYEELFERAMKWKESVERKDIKLEVSLRDNHLACGLRLSSKNEAYWVSFVEDRDEEVVMRLRHKCRDSKMEERLLVMRKDTEYRGQPINGPERVYWE